MDTQIQETAPKIADIISELLQMKADLSAINKEAESIKREISVLEGEIINYLRQQDVQSLSTTGGRVTLVKEVVPTVTNWDAVFDFVKNNDAFYLLQKRISSTAWREFTQQEGDIEGIEAYETTKLSTRKA